MEAQKQVLTYDKHIWTLTSPAHHTEVDKALVVANAERQELAAGGTWAGDVHVSADDEHVVVFFDANRPEKVTRSAAAAE